MPKRKALSQPSGVSASKWKKFKRIVRKRKPTRPFTTGQVKALKEVVKQAKGTYSATRAATALTTTMAAYPGVSNAAYFNVAEGDGDGNREGDSISAQSLTIRGTLRSADLKDTTVRLMLIQYVNFSGAHIKQVLDNYQIQSGGFADANHVVNSFRKLNPEVKYRVLAQKIVTLKGGPNATNNMAVRQFLITHKFSKAQSRMNYEDETADSPKTNPVWLYACYAQQTATHTAPLIEYEARGKFIR